MAMSHGTNNWRQMAAAITASSSTRDVVLAAGAALQQPASRLEPLAAYLVNDEWFNTCAQLREAVDDRDAWGFLRLPARLKLRMKGIILTATTGIGGVAITAAAPTQLPAPAPAPATSSTPALAPAPAPAPKPAPTAAVEVASVDAIQLDLGGDLTDNALVASPIVSAKVTGPEVPQAALAEARRVWTKLVDDETGAEYYYNSETGESRWEMPRELRKRRLKPPPASLGAAGSVGLHQAKEEAAKQTTGDKTGDDGNSASASSSSSSSSRGAMRSSLSKLNNALMSAFGGGRSKREDATSDRAVGAAAVGGMQSQADSNASPRSNGSSSSSSSSDEGNDAGDTAGDEVASSATAVASAPSFRLGSDASHTSEELRRLAGAENLLVFESVGNNGSHNGSSNGSSNGSGVGLGSSSRSDGSWACPACTYLNVAKSAKCSMCHGNKPQLDAGRRTAGELLKANVGAGHFATAAFSFIRHQRNQDLKALMTYGAVLPTSRDESGNTLLAVAAQNNNVPAVRMLIEFGVDVNAINRLGNSALHFAIKYGHTEVGEALLNAGAVDADVRRPTTIASPVKVGRHQVPSAAPVPAHDDRHESFLDSVYAAAANANAALPDRPRKAPASARTSASSPSSSTSLRSSPASRSSKRPSRVRPGQRPASARRRVGAGVGAGVGVGAGAGAGSGASVKPRPAARSRPKPSAQLQARRAAGGARGAGVGRSPSSASKAGSASRAPAAASSSSSSSSGRIVYRGRHSRPRPTATSGAR